MHSPGLSARMCDAERQPLQAAGSLTCGMLSGLVLLQDLAEVIVRGAARLDY